MVFMKLVSGYGSLAIAAFGIGGRIENIAILPALGMSGAVLTIAGQNYDRRSFAQSGDTLRELES
jgi:Na+-driven multidrug efflux pump